MVLILYEIGKILEEKAINNSRNSIKDLMNLKQEFANKKVNSKYKVVNTDDIKVNDILLIKKGEKIPVDGIVINGKTELDTSALTGEVDLFQVSKDSKVLSGCINVGNIIEMNVTNEYKNSTVSKILELVSDATIKKTKTETFVNKLSKIYTPVIIFLALLIAIFLPFIINITYTESIYRSLIFLVVSCPCAIAISVPLSYFTGIGVASKHGILIKGSNYLDNLINVRKMVFDKTGTITNGMFEVSNINILDDNYDLEDIKCLFVKGEKFSNHPIAKSIVKLVNYEIDTNDVTNYREITGKGIMYYINNDIIKIGNKDFCNGFDDDKTLFI